MSLFYLTLIHFKWAWFNCYFIVVIYYAIYPLSQQESKLNMLKSLLITMISLSVFYNSHHKDNYYQLKFRDIYIGFPSYNPYIGPFLFIFNQFAHTLMIFIWNVISWEVWKLNINVNEEILPIVSQSSSPAANQEGSLAFSETVGKSKNIVVQNEFTNSSKGQCADNHIMISFYCTYIMSILVISIWLKYLFEVMKRDVPLKDMDLMFIRTFWMALIQLLHLIFVCQA